MKQLTHQIRSLLDQGEDLVLATVVSRSGSTPRLAGARMFIRRDGRIGGTIGGGLVEARAIEAAHACFAEQGVAQRFFDLSDRDAAITGMICGGRMELYLEYLEANAANRAVFGDLCTALEAGRPSFLVCPLDPQGGPARLVIDHTGRVSRGQAPESLVRAVRLLRTAASGAGLVTDQGRDFLVSSFARDGNLYLIGAGHVSACTAEAAARVGFRVTIMDDRDEFANRERFPRADQILVLDSFADCFKHEPIDRDSFLVIVTRGHLHDLEVLEQALRTNAGYIGMIGSRNKRNALYAKLRDQGVSEARLEQVRCPIGLAIEADTPEEIAVSILGELIHHRALGRKAWLRS